MLSGNILKSLYFCFLLESQLERWVEHRGSNRVNFLLPSKISASFHSVTSRTCTHTLTTKLRIKIQLFLKQDQI